MKNKDKYPTWVKSTEKDIYRSIEERDGTPDYTLYKEGNSCWRIKQRTSGRSEYFASQKKALEWAGGTLTIKEGVDDE